MDTDATDRIVRRILRVDHAGEHGAIAIYSAQLATLGGKHPELCRWLRETLAHEERHRAVFQEAMPERNAKACRALSVWSIGGALLGWLTAIMGVEAVMACTASVEQTVHGHLQQQAKFLDSIDPRLAALVREIQIEEDEHLSFAESHHDSTSMGARVMSKLIAFATEVLIAISTRGDSLSLSRTLSA